LFRENMECNEKDEVQAMSQEFGLVKTNISSDEADDSEDSCAEFLNAWKDYPELYWKSYFSGDEGGYVLLKNSICIYNRML